MEEMEENIQSTTKKISKLNDFIALSLRRNKISKELDLLTVETIKIRDLLTKAHYLMQQELNNYKHEYDDIMSEMRIKQITLMGYLIKEKQRKIKDEENLNLVFSCGKSKLNLPVAGSQSVVRQLDKNFAKFSLSRALSATPKIKITEYKESPLVKKKINFIPFEFEEFDIKVTQQQFNTVPKYMCGRETLEQLNNFLETVVIYCFNEKYKLIHKERSCVKVNDMELWKLYNEQALCLPGRTFITSGDINRKLNKMIDKKTQNRLVMLRHIGILNEVHIKQTIYYIWLGSSHQ